MARGDGDDVIAEDLVVLELLAEVLRVEAVVARQTLVEVYSGHGNSELWRDLRDTEVAEDGSLRCAAPAADYLPCCWRAGEIIEERCEAEGLAAATCTERKERTRRWFLDLPPDQARQIVPGTTPDDWLECGQLAGTFLPAFEYRPRMSAQYGLAVRPEGATPGENGAFRFGFIASSGQIGSEYPLAR